MVMRCKRCCLAGLWLVSVVLAGNGKAVAQDGPDFSPQLFACYEKAGDTAERQACVSHVAEPCMAQDGGQTTLGMSMCLNDEAEAWDVLLNQEYRETMAFMKAMDVDEREYFPEFANREEALKDAQRAWIAFRDAECGLAYAEWGSGSHRNVAATACMADMTATRTIELRAKREVFE